MKALLIIMVVSLAGCSTSKFDKRISSEAQLNKYASQEDKIVGSELPDWVDAEGINSGYVYAVGEAEESVGQNVQVIKELAAHNAKMKIVQRLPGEYKYIVQNSLSTASNNEFNKIEISKGDLFGLQGVKTSRKYTTCRKMIRHTDFGSKVKRICFVQASVSLKNLNDAISRTIARKYGEETSAKFDKILRKQVEKELLKD